MLWLECRDKLGQSTGDWNREVVMDEAKRAWHFCMGVGSGEARAR